MAGVIDHANFRLTVDSMLLNALDLSTASDPVVRLVEKLFSNGTGSGQASQVWHDSRTLSASANENLDLAASLVNAFGVTLTFTKVKAIIVEADSGNTNDVQFTRPASNGVPLFMAAGDGIALAPGDVFVFMGSVGKTVTASTGDLFNVANSAGGSSVTYRVYILGTD